MNDLAIKSIARVTKLILAPMSPLQYFLDSPGLTHVYFLEQAYSVLENDGKERIASFFRPYHKQIHKGLLWADHGWKNVSHYYSKPDQEGSQNWPGATAEAQYYFNKSLSFLTKDVFKGMFFLGACLHLIQDMCVPHHSKGIIFDGHKEFETWATENWKKHSVTSGGLYLAFSHPSQWIEYNARISEDYYPLVSLRAKCDEATYKEAAQSLIPLTIRTTSGFLDSMVTSLKGVTLRLE
ncbi:MAG: zinc dependent phospholipase C family protein [Desulfitobacterium hafniense]|nr:zinc dependent phospholipase C family protein [Desulfitobacterium hafniense]